MAVNDTPESFTKASTQYESVRLYGRFLEITQDERYISFVYCGFKAGLNDVRLPTARVFRVQRDQILEEGVVTDYQLSGEPVHFYHIPLTAEVHETVSRKINIGVEVAISSGGTLAGLVATSPRRPEINKAELEAISSLDLLERTRKVVAGASEVAFDEGEVLRAYCGTYRQTYSWTGEFLGPHLDPYGADCD